MPKSSHLLGLSDQALELIASRFRVLSEASRLKLLQALRARDLSVTELMKATGLGQANTSRHLATLTHAGMLSRRKNGLKVIYSIADPHIIELCEHVCGSVQRRAAQNAKLFE
jgi:DNA-binding transcriptional ArsR family regulator